MSEPTSGRQLRKGAVVGRGSVPKNAPQSVATASEPTSDRVPTLEWEDSA